MTKLCDVNPAAKDKLPPQFADKSGVGVHYADAFIKPMNVSLPDGTRVACKRKGLKITLTVGTNGQFAVDAGQTNRLALALNAKSGVLTGSFFYPSGKSAHNLYGAFASPSLGGAGYFLDTNSETGWFEITAR